MIYITHFMFFFIYQKNLIDSNYIMFYLDLVSIFSDMASFFFVFGCLFCVSVNLPVFWLHNLVLHKPFVRYQNSK
jgi:hypothetical protein